MYKSTTMMLSAIVALAALMMHCGSNLDGIEENVSQIAPHDAQEESVGNELRRLHLVESSDHVVSAERRLNAAGVLFQPVVIDSRNGHYDYRITFMKKVRDTQQIRLDLITFREAATAYLDGIEVPDATSQAIEKKLAATQSLVAAYLLP